MLAIGAAQPAPRIVLGTVPVTVNEPHAPVDDLRSTRTGIDQRLCEPALRLSLTTPDAWIRLCLGPFGQHGRLTDDNRALGDALGDLERPFDLRLVKEQGHTQTIEPLGLAVARQILDEGGEHLRVHLQQVANAVGELDPVQTPHGNPPTRVPRGAFCVTQSPVDPIDDRLELGRRRPWFLLRRHRAQVDHVHDLLPPLGRARSFEVGRELVDTESGIRALRPMATKAVTGKKRLNLLDEGLAFDVVIPRHLSPRDGVRSRGHDKKQEQ